jgi:pyroglutamyl-peptidase
VTAAAIERDDPAVVILLGQAGGRACLSVERVAINVDDARIADNAGLQPVDEPVAPAGPAAYFATVPIKAMTAAIRDAGIPAEVSNSAGTFVCNHLFYGVLHYLAASGRDARAGFIHVPWLEAQAVARPGEPAMALATMVRGVEAAIAAALETATDVKMAAGTLD